MSEVEQREVSPEMRFLEHLKAMPPSGRAALRRSLSFPLGAYSKAFRWVEPFTHAYPSDSARYKAYYLIAGMFASHDKAGEHLRQRSAHSDEISLATALGQLDREVTEGATKEDGASAQSIGAYERRFIALLEADPENLPIYLRQIVSLLSARDKAINYVRLHRDLYFLLKVSRTDWDEQKKTQVRQQWARDFYHYVSIEAADQEDGDARDNDLED